MGRRLAALAALAALAGCKDLADADAVKLVETYDARLVEAFRAGDFRLVDPLAGPTDGRRIAALIGVKLDLGITLDSRLLDLKVLGVERRPGEVVVRTEERWYYRDRRIGTGEQVGPDSTDHYFMRYHLRKPEGRWVVDEVEFEKEPVVGREEVPLAGDAPAFHGFQEPPREHPPDADRPAPAPGAAERRR